MNPKFDPQPQSSRKTIMNVYEAIQTLETERLVLRRFIPSDAKDVLSLKMKDSTRIHRMITIATEAEAEAFVDKKASLLANRKGIAWAITAKDGSGYLGSIELTYLVDEDKAHIQEIGFYVGIPFRRQGYASEAIKRVTTSAFETYDYLQRVHAEVVPSNAGSIHTLEKCGFSQEGILKSWNMGNVDGGWVPVSLLVLALTRDSRTDHLSGQG
jgi:ribosomal-protein-alanine N-acetyltransferase